MIEASLQGGRTRKILFSSTFDLFGPTAHLEPPRKLSDPIQPQDVYSKNKAECEQLLKASQAEWAIYRFADVPPMEARQPHPIMYRIPLDQRMEVIHPDDVALAIANGIDADIWGHTWLIGGGPTCQVRYKDLLEHGLRQANLPMLPAEAFGQEPYCTDWLDTTASQNLLHYQRHSFHEIMADIDRANPTSPLNKLFIRATQPLIKRWLLSLSPHYRQTRS